MAKKITNAQQYFQETRNRRKIRRVFISVLAIAVLAGIFVYGIYWVVARSSVFRIENLTVTGNKLVGTQDIYRRLGEKISGTLAGKILGDRNMLAWPSAIDGSFAVGLGAIKDISIEKNYFGKSILIKVSEKEPYAVWCLAKKTAGESLAIETSTKQNVKPEFECYFSDDRGAAIRPTYAVEGSLLKNVIDETGREIRPGDSVISLEQFAVVKSIFEVLQKTGLGNPPVYLKDLGLQEVEARIPKGPVLYFSLRFPADFSADVIRSLRPSAEFDKLEYIDFRVENRVYYK